MKSKPVFVSTMIAAAMLLGACGQGAPNSDQAIPSRINAPRALDEAGLESALGAKIEAFVRGLEAADEGAVKALLSSELLERIATRGRAASFEENLSVFVARERKELKRESSGFSELQAGVRVTSLEPSADGGVIAVRIAFGERSLPKPFYFVLEGGEYKLNVVAPEFSVTADSYFIENRDAEWRGFTCSSSWTKWVAPLESVNYWCKDTCNFFFPGTVFEVNGIYAECAWNLWSTDMRIIGNVPVCQTACD